MKLNLQKKLAAKIAKVGKKRVKINPEFADDAKAAITKADVGSLISEGKIEIKNKEGVSRHRARKLHLQRKKGRRKGYGSRKGSKNSKISRKRKWVNSIRILRKTLSNLKKDGKISKKSYRKLYMLAKGGFFRSRKHLLLYTKKNNMFKK